MFLKFKLGLVILSIFSLLVLGLDIQPPPTRTPGETVDIYGRVLPDRGAPSQEWFLPAPGFLNAAGLDRPSNSGIFLPYVVYPAGIGDFYVGIGDFNDDGLNDVAICENDSGSQLRIFLQNVSGTLDSPTIYAAGWRPNSLIVGDFNHDSLDDVALVNSSTTNTLRVYLQQIGGGLAPPVLYDTQNGPDALAVGDLNFDGLDDIAVSHWLAPSVGVFVQQTNGAFSSQALYPAPEAGWDDIDIGDLNHDGRTDVVKSNGQGSGNPSLSVYLQNMAGALDGPISYNIAANVFPSGIAVGDISGDGLDDIAASYGGNSPRSKIAVFTQTLTGTLELSATYNAYDIPEPVEIADVNNDGLLDVLAAHGGWEALSVYLQGTNGRLLPYERYNIPNASHYFPQGMDVGDINNDGWADVVIADYTDGLIVLYNSGTFVPTATPTPLPTSLITPSPEPSLTTTPTATSTVQLTGTASPTPDWIRITPTATNSPTLTPSYTATRSVTPAPTLTLTPTPSQTFTPTSTLSQQPVPTNFIYVPLVKNGS